MYGIRSSLLLLLEIRLYCIAIVMLNLAIAEPKLFNGHSFDFDLKKKCGKGHAVLWICFMKKERTYVHQLFCSFVMKSTLSRLIGHRVHNIRCSCAQFINATFSQEIVKKKNIQIELKSIRLVNYSIQHFCITSKPVFENWRKYETENSKHQCETVWKL